MQTHGPCEEAGLTLEELLEHSEAERDKLQVQRDELLTRVVFLEDELVFMNSQFALLRQNNDCGLFLKLSEDKDDFQRPTVENKESFQRPSGASLASISTCASMSHSSDRPLLHGGAVSSAEETERLLLPQDGHSLCNTAMENLKNAFLTNDTAGACNIVEHMVNSQESLQYPRKTAALSIGTSRHKEDVQGHVSSGQISLSFSCDFNWSTLESNPAKQKSSPSNWHEPSFQGTSKWFLREERMLEEMQHASSFAMHKESPRNWHKPFSQGISKCFEQQERIQEGMHEEAQHHASTDYTAQSRRVQHGVLLQEAMGHRRHRAAAKGMYDVPQFALKYRNKPVEKMIQQERTACTFHLLSTLVSASAPL